MERTARIVTAACLALLFCGIFTAQPAAAEETAVVAQDLVKLRVPGKVAAVLWTRRKEHFTLQVLLDDESRPGRRPAANRPVENVQIWLLDKNGMQMTPDGRIETPRCSKAGLRCMGYEVQYSYPAFAGDEAVVVVLRLGEEVLIEKLSPSPTERRQAIPQHLSASRQARLPPAVAPRHPAPAEDPRAASRVRRSSPRSRCRTVPADPLPRRLPAPSPSRGTAHA